MRLNQYIFIYTVFNTVDSFGGSPSELNGNCHSIRSIQLHLLMHTRLRLLIFLSSPCFVSSFVPVPLFPNGNPYARMKYASQIRTNCVPFTKHFFMYIHAHDICSSFLHGSLVASKMARVFKCVDERKKNGFNLNVRHVYKCKI